MFVCGVCVCVGGGEGDSHESIDIVTEFGDFLCVCACVRCVRVCWWGEEKESSGIVSNLLK